MIEEILLKVTMQQFSRIITLQANGEREREKPNTESVWEASVRPLKRVYLHAQVIGDCCGC